MRNVWCVNVCIRLALNIIGKPLVILEICFCFVTRKTLSNSNNQQYQANVVEAFSSTCRYNNKEFDSSFTAYLHICPFLDKSLRLPQRVEIFGVNMNI